MAVALHIIQPYGAGASSEVGTRRSSHCMTTAKLPTYHICVRKLPFVVTNCSPLALIEDLHSTGALA